MPVYSAPRRVLVVDNDKVFADALASVLNGNGFDATAVYSGGEAIENALKSPPDFVVMDVFMYEIDGVDAAIAICEWLPHCQIVLMSGRLEAIQQLAKASIRNHRFELLMKPIQLTDLLQTFGAGGKTCVSAA